MSIKNVDQEVKFAYADCWMGNSRKAEKVRDLNFRASGYLSKKNAIKILGKYVQGYNSFDYEALEYLPDDSKICIAREGSVCLYVQTDKKITNRLRNKMNADELDEVDGEYRIWWD